MTMPASSLSKGGVPKKKVHFHEIVHTNFVTTLVDSESPPCSNKVPSTSTCPFATDDQLPPGTLLDQHQESSQNQFNIIQVLSDTATRVPEFERHHEHSPDDQQDTECYLGIPIPLERKRSEINLLFPETLDKQVAPISKIRNSDTYLSAKYRKNITFDETFHEDPIEFDLNNNLVKWTPLESEKKLLAHASYLFQKDRAHELARTVSLLPRGREYAVFTVFTDIAKLLGYHKQRPKRQVEFPQEVIAQYEQKGDVAGKERFVPTAKQPYRSLTASSKKRKLSAVYSTWTVREDEFTPRVERIDNYNRMDHFCERYCITCDCCKSSKKPDLTAVMEGYLSDLNVASLFLHGHATRTFESALSTLEFVRMRTISFSNIKQTLHRNSNYARSRLGILSSAVWILGYCIRSIVKVAVDRSSADNATVLPSEQGLRKVIEQFAGLCLLCSEGIKVILQYSYNFYNFCNECIRILQVLQIHVGFRAEFNLSPPLKRGDGLQLIRTLKKRDIVKLNAIVVQVGKTSDQPPTAGEGDEEDDKEVEWTQFEKLSGNEKVYCLRDLMNQVSEGLTIVQTQLRFLLDDIVDSVKDVTEADLLFIFADMYDRIKFLENIGTSSIKPELEQIRILMTEFCRDFQIFIELAQQIMKRFMELRDTIHVTYEFLCNGLKLEMLGEMVPSTMFKRKRSVPVWCGGGANHKRKLGTRFQPKYNFLDFFRIHYTDLVKGNYEIQGSKYFFRLELGEELIKAIIPRAAQPNWGEMDAASPRGSLDLELESPEADEENQQDLRPILVSPQRSLVTSPRDSITSGTMETPQSRIGSSGIPQIEPASPASSPKRSS